MAEYRERARGTPAASSTVTGPTNLVAIPAYASLAEQYGLTDMQFGAPEDTVGQTLEKEYQSYITAPLSKQGTDMIKFWEVGNNLFIASLIY
jgi:hypothetical protein